MWLHLLDSADTDLLTKSPQEIINKMAWKARDWARRQLCPMRHNTPEGGRWNPMVELDDDGWLYLADTLTDDHDPYADVDHRLTIAAEWGPAITAMLETLTGTTAGAVARLLMEGHNKIQTAKRLGKSPAAVTYNLKKIRTTLEEIMLSQAGAC